MPEPVNDDAARARAPKLWVPGSVPVLRHRRVVRTVTLPNGERAKVTIDDSGTTKQIERNEGLDAVVRPKTITIKIRRA